jgi:glyoxylase-like metal-dependent hydrolase (beta-lactamase superfamily II)
VFDRLGNGVYSYSDICQVYVIVRGDRALLVDCGTGAILDELGDLGVSGVDWVLHTHHHRDQCQGDERLLEHGAKIAVPEREARLFENVESFWQDLTICGTYDCTNVANSPARSVDVAYRVPDYGTFAWKDVRLIAHPTPGHTKGSLTYIGNVDDRVVAFCGDLIHSGGRVWTLYDLQWHYSDPDGLNAAMHSVHALRRKRPDVLAPSHGAASFEADADLAVLENRLTKLYDVVGQRYAMDCDPPKATDVQIERVSEHLLAVTHSAANFYVLRARDGRAMLFDYGFPSLQHALGQDARFVEHSLEELRRDYGLDTVETLVLTHYHDDHVAGAGFLTGRFGTEIWAHERFRDILENPTSYDLLGIWRDGIAVARTVVDRETVQWAEYDIRVEHCPGHTWYAAAYFMEVDGLRVAVIGDELALNGRGRLRGNGPVFRNRIGADAFRRSIETISAFRPDVLLTGHDGAIHVTEKQLAEARDWSRQLEECIRAIAAYPDEIDFALDRDVVSVHPYEAHGRAGTSIELRVDVRNHHGHRATARLRLRAPTGWRVAPVEGTIELSGGESGHIVFTVKPPSHASPGVRHVVIAEAEIGERQLGPVGEGLVVLET